jgi:hypothetical protein
MNGLGVFEPLAWCVALATVYEGILLHRPLSLGAAPEAGESAARAPALWAGHVRGGDTRITVLGAAGEVTGSAYLLPLLVRHGYHGPIVVHPKSWLIRRLRELQDLTFLAHMLWQARKPLCINALLVWRYRSRNLQKSLVFEPSPAWRGSGRFSSTRRWVHQTGDSRTGWRVCHRSIRGSPD